MGKEKQISSMDKDQFISNNPETGKQLEKEIDLNLLFPDEKSDLNLLFPEYEMRSLLKMVQKNRSEIEKMTGRVKNDLPDNSFPFQDAIQKKID